MNASIENIVCVQEFAKKTVFEQLTVAVACSASRRHGSPEVLGDRHVWAAMTNDIYIYVYHIYDLSYARGVSHIT